jgi:hypothetical protein
MGFRRVARSSQIARVDRVGGLAPHLLACGQHRLPHPGGGRVPLAPVLRECFLQHGHEIARDELGGRAVERRRLGQVLAHDRGDVAAEGHPTGEQLVDDDPERVDVRPLVELDRVELLRAHVVDRAHGPSVVRHPRMGFALGDAEVHHPDDASRVAHEVGGLQVAMDDAGVVDRGETFRDLERDLEAVFPLERSDLVQRRLEVGSIHELHDDEGNVPVLVVLVDAAHVPMPHLARQPHLVAEAREDVGAQVDLRKEDLEGDRLRELAVVGLVDEAHSPSAEQGQDLVPAGEHGADVQVSGQGYGAHDTHPARAAQLPTHCAPRQA